MAGRLFACRHCYRLVYTTQRGNALDLADARQARLCRKLGADCGELLPPRPKWMRHRTYARLLGELDAARGAQDAAFCDMAARLLGRFGKSGAA